MLFSPDLFSCFELFKLYKLKPFLKKLVSGELIYFANAFCKTVLPPEPMYSPK